MNLEGRWGSDGEYDGFWRQIRESILRTYKIKPVPVQAASKPRVTWIKRYGKSSSRDDFNIDAIEKIFSKYFEFSFLSDEHFNSPKGKDMYGHAQKLLQHVHDTDVMVGLFGAGLWNALFLKENKIFVELKGPYGFCGYENGRNLANHNR